MKVLKVLSVETMNIKITEKFILDEIKVVYIGSNYHFDRLKRFVYAHTNIDKFSNNYWIQKREPELEEIQGICADRVTIIIDQILPKKTFNDICELSKGCGYDLIFGPQTNYTEKDLPWYKEPTKPTVVCARCEKTLDDEETPIEKTSEYDEYKCPYCIVEFKVYPTKKVKKAVSKLKLNFSVGVFGERGINLDFLVDEASRLPESLYDRIPPKLLRKPVSDIERYMKSPSDFITEVLLPSKKPIHIDPFVYAVYSALIDEKGETHFKPVETDMKTFKKFDFQEKYLRSLIEIPISPNLWFGLDKGDTSNDKTVITFGGTQCGKTTKMWEKLRKHMEKGNVFLPDSFAKERVSEEDHMKHINDFLNSDMSCDEAIRKRTSEMEKEADAFMKKETPKPTDNRCERGPDKKPSKNSDDHYRDIEGNSQTEPIVVMEELNDRLFKAGIPSESALSIVLAQKHITRAGLKKGDGWEKDINKAINYLTRSVTGKWVGDE